MNTLKFSSLSAIEGGRPGPTVYYIDIEKLMGPLVNRPVYPILD